MVRHCSSALTDGAMPLPNPDDDGPTIERQRLQLEVERLRLERQKTALEFRLKRIELSTRSKKSWKEIISNPLTLAVVGGFITVMTTVVSNSINSQANIHAEVLKNQLARESAHQALQADLIKKFVEGPSIDAVRGNLAFLVDVGLLPEYAGRIRTYLSANPTAAPQVPSSAIQIPPSIRRPRLNALLVGISQYESIQPLLFPAKDARDLAEHLNTQTPIYSTVDTRLILDGSATRERIIEELERLVRNSSPIDTSVILLAGHAATAAGGHYFASVDVRPGRIAETAVSGREIEARLARIQGRVLVLIDSNFVGITNVQQVSGPQAQAPRFLTSPGMSNVLIESMPLQENRPTGERNRAGPTVVDLSVLVETGVAVINSAGQNENSIESRNLGNGILTHVVLAGLRGSADSDADGLIRLNELAGFIQREVRSVAQGRQSPLASVPPGLADAPLFVVTNNRTRGGTTPNHSPLQTPAR